MVVAEICSKMVDQPPSATCWQQLHRIKCLLKILERSKNLERKSQQRAVVFVRSLLKLFLEVSKKGYFQEWVKSIQPLLQSIASHFLRLIILTSRKPAVQKNIEEEINNDIELIYELFGLSDVSLIIIAVKTVGILDKEAVYQCKCFSMIASKILSQYVTKKKFLKQREILMWAVLLARFWLQFCNELEMKDVEERISSILPNSMRVKGKRFQRRKLLEMPADYLVEVLDFPELPSNSITPFSSNFEEGSKAYKHLLQIASTVGSVANQLESITEKKTSGKGNDQSLNNPCQESLTEIAPSVRENLYTESVANSSQDFIPSSIQSGETIEWNLKRKRDSQPQEASLGSPCKKQLTESAKSPRKMDIKAKSLSLTSSKQRSKELMEIKGTESSEKRNAGKTDNTDVHEKGSAEEEFSLWLESDTENPSPKEEESSKGDGVGKKAAKASKKKSLTPKEESSQHSTKESPKADIQNIVEDCNRNQTIDETVKSETNSLTDQIDKELSLPIKKRFIIKEELTPKKFNSSGEDFETSNFSDIEKTLELRSPSGQSGKKEYAKQNSIKDIRKDMPRGWYRLIRPRITTTLQGKAQLRMDVNVYSPDGKQHNCKKYMTLYVSKYYPNSNITAEKVSSWYKIEPELREKVLLENRQLLESIEKMNQSTEKNYTPLKVDIKTASSKGKVKELTKQANNPNSRQLTDMKKAGSRIGDPKLKSDMVNNSDCDKGSHNSGEIEPQKGKACVPNDPYEFVDESLETCLKFKLAMKKRKLQANRKNYFEKMEEKVGESLTNSIQILAEVHQEDICNTIETKEVQEKGTGKTELENLDEKNECKAEISSIVSSVSESEQPNTENHSFKESHCECVNNRDMEATESTNEPVDKGCGSPLWFLIPQKTKGLVKPGDVIYTKVRKEHRVKNSAVRDSASSVVASMPNGYSDGLGLSDSSCPSELKKESMNNIKETDLKRSLTPESVIDYEKISGNNRMKKEYVLHEGAEKLDTLQVDLDPMITRCSTPKTIIEDKIQSPNVSAVCGSSNKHSVEVQMTPQNNCPSLHHVIDKNLHKSYDQETQTNRDGLQQVPVLKDKESGERKALVTVPPAVSGKDILLELKWYKVVPDNCTFLLDSYIVSLSHQEIIPPTIMEKQLLVAMEMQQASELTGSTSKNDGRIHEVHGGREQGCQRQLLEEFNSVTKSLERNGRTSSSCDRKAEENPENNQIHSDEFGTPLLNSLVQHLDESQTSEQCTQTSIHNQQESSKRVTGSLMEKSVHSTELNGKNDSIYSDEESLIFMEEGDINETEYFSCAGRLIMPIKNYKKCAFDCSQLSQLKKKTRIHCDLWPTNVAHCRLCSQHQKDEAWYLDNLFNLELLDPSCPICRLTLEDVCPCTYHPELIQLNQDKSEVELPSPLDHMTETARLVYWEYVGLVLSLFPGKASLPLPRTWDHWSACSTHAVRDPMDLMATLPSSQLSAVDSEIVQCQELAQKSSPIPDSVKNISNEQSTALKINVKMSECKTNTMKADFQILDSFPRVRRKEFQTTVKKTDKIQSDSPGMQPSQVSSDNVIAGYPLPKSKSHKIKQQKINNMLFKRLFKNRIKQGKSDKRKCTDIKKSDEKVRAYNRYLKSTVASPFIIFPKNESLNIETIAENEEKPKADKRAIDREKSVQEEKVKKKEKKKNRYLASDQKKRTKEKSDRSWGVVEFEALERFKNDQRHALEKLRERTLSEERH